VENSSTINSVVEMYRNVP